jgi:hypothetical protein
MVDEKAFSSQKPSPRRGLGFWVWGWFFAFAVSGLHFAFAVSGLHFSFLFQVCILQSYLLRAYPKIISEAPEKSGCLLAEARAN